MASDMTTNTDVAMPELPDNDIDGEEIGKIIADCTVTFEGGFSQLDNDMFASVIRSAMEDYARAAIEQAALPQGMKWATFPGADQPCRHGHRLCLACMNGPLAKRFPVPIEPPTVEAVEQEVGMGAGAWDCVDPAEIISAVLRLATKGKP